MCVERGLNLDCKVLAHCKSYQISFKEVAPFYPQGLRSDMTEYAGLLNFSIHYDSYHCCQCCLGLQVPKFSDFYQSAYCIICFCRHLSLHESNRLQLWQLYRCCLSARLSFNYNLYPARRTSFDTTNSKDVVASAGPPACSAELE